MTDKKMRVKDMPSVVPQERTIEPPGPTSTGEFGLIPSGTADALSLTAPSGQEMELTVRSQPVEVEPAQEEL